VGFTRDFVTDYQTVKLCSKVAKIMVFLQYSIQNVFLKFVTVILTVVT